MDREIIINQGTRIAERQQRIDYLKEIHTMEAFSELLDLEIEANLEWEEASRRFEYLRKIQ
jgi:hypothetical protein